MPVDREEALRRLRRADAAVRAAEDLLAHGFPESVDLEALQALRSTVVRLTMMLQNPSEND